MPLSIVRNDITLMEVDAIVNAANNRLLGGGGVDGSIHRVAGPQLLEECRTLNGCETGQAKITSGYRLPAKYVIHTVGPVWQGGNDGEEALLRSCYRESLKLALLHKCDSVAFPLISAGVYGYPKAQAIKIAIDEISSFLLEHDMMVFLVVFNKSVFEISEKLFTDIEQFIDDHYVAVHSETYGERMRRYDAQFDNYVSTFVMEDAAAYAVEKRCEPKKMAPKASQPDEVGQPDEASQPDGVSQPYAVNWPDLVSHARISEPSSLDDMLKTIDESFSQMLLRMIDERGMKDSECYKKANIDRKLFSKIRNDIFYKPSKTTVIAFAIALELSLAETKEMLMKAGYALSRSSKFDIIIEYFILKGNYNIHEINEALFAFDQMLLGA